MKNSATGWGWLARVFHWLMAFLLVFLFALGTYMHEFVNDIVERIFLTHLHKSLGAIAFFLVLARLLWHRVAPERPDAPKEAKVWERHAAHWVHIALYVLMIGVPLSGWLSASASPLQETAGIENTVFGWFALPDPFTPGSKALEEIFSEAHETMANLLALLVVLHVAGAIKHHVIYRNDVLRRMISGR